MFHDRSEIFLRIRIRSAGSSAGGMGRSHTKRITDQ
jgi:hypothetical protein